jgi:ubiquinone/menaquinone biosynthesis C-methylase UbiE
MGQPNPTEQAKRKAAVTYNAAAEHFDDEPLGFWEVTGRRTVERLNLKLGLTVLDVGCGTGASALPEAEAVGETGKVIGADLAQNLLDLASAKAVQRNLHNVEFRLADMTNLGFPDGHFDAVVSVFSVFFVPDMEGLVRELWRMVKPSGKLAITTWGVRFFEPVYSIWREAIRNERPDLYTDFNPWDRISLPEQVSELLNTSGIPNAEIVPESGSQMFRSPEDWWTVVLGSGLRATVDAMDATTAAKIHDRTVGWTRDNGVQSIETNVIYAVAIKDKE